MKYLTPIVQKVEERRQAYFAWVNGGMKGPSPIEGFRGFTYGEVRS